MDLGNYNSEKPVTTELEVRRVLVALPNNLRFDFQRFYITLLLHLFLIPLFPNIRYNYGVILSHDDRLHWQRSAQPMPSKSIYITSIVALSRRNLPDAIGNNPKLQVVIMNDFNSYPDPVLK